MVNSKEQSRHKMSALLELVKPQTIMLCEGSSNRLCNTIEVQVSDSSKILLSPKDYDADELIRKGHRFQKCILSRDCYIHHLHQKGMPLEKAQKTAELLYFGYDSCPR
jgi:GTP-dependent phosphoenolpyruvate carboxykinase